MIKRLRENQSGITLIEMVVVTAIVGALSGVLGPLSSSILVHTDRSNASVTAVCEIEESARWITSDGNSAQTTDLIPGSEAVGTLTLCWTEPDSGVSYEIIYSLSGSELQRSESINEGSPTVRTVARYITDVGFSQPGDEESLFKVSLTSSGGSHQVNETREYHVALRAMG